MAEKKYSGYGYHGGGRKATGIKRVLICISGQPEQIEELKKMAAQEEKTVSAFILEKTGVVGYKIKPEEAHREIKKNFDDFQTKIARGLVEWHSYF